MLRCHHPIFIRSDAVLLLRKSHRAGSDLHVDSCCVAVGEAQRSFGATAVRGGEPIVDRHWIADGRTDNHGRPSTVQVLLPTLVGVIQ